MADEVDTLVGRVQDPALRADLRAHIARLKAKRTFGLVYESHLPERVHLPEHPILPGASVVHRDEAESSTYQVGRVRAGKATIRKSRDPDGSPLSEDDLAEIVDEVVDVDALVVITDFGQSVYPGLRRVGSIERGGDKPFQVAIKGENHHVLEALSFSHTHKVDCIYIDPPYNTGDSDWKYDNNYVDKSDSYRHSKWLAFMERRLKLAKQLLNPEASVLIVTIDEKEVHRLGLLLEQVFPDARAQMVTIVINAPGQTRKQELARVEEYAFFLFFGAAEPCPAGDDLLNEQPSRNPRTVRWESLLRSGTNSRRGDRPALFYPVFIDPTEPRIVEIGDPKTLDTERTSWTVPTGAVAIWPLKSDGTEGNWRASPGYLRQLHAQGMVRLGEYRFDEGRGTIWYLGKAAVRGIEAGVIQVTGRDSQNAVAVQYAGEALSSRRTTVKTVWNRPSHHAGWHGSALVRALLPGHSFPFPKALYAVEDAIRLAVGDKPDALVLDFFAGSGTTTHAVARLNRQDGGRRQSIVVTNNEVSADEATELRKQGIRPGDLKWETLGIFDHITRPRITAAMTGKTPRGTAVKGEYKFSDTFPMAEGFDENVEFIELSYLDPSDVELDRAFDGVAPLLWLRAGARGPVLDLAKCTDDGGNRKSYAWSPVYGILFDPDSWRRFVAELPDAATAVFVVTDSQTTFAGVSAELPSRLDVVRLYENYLSIFRPNQGYIS